MMTDEIPRIRINLKKGTCTQIVPSIDQHIEIVQPNAGTDEHVPISSCETRKANLPPYTKNSVVPKCSHNNLPGDVLSSKIITAQ